MLIASSETSVISAILRWEICSLARSIRIFFANSLLAFSDGSIIYIVTWGSTFCLIDVNGNKGSNIVGRDIFPVRFEYLGDSSKIVGLTYFSGYGAVFDECNHYSESEYLEKGCYYSKIVADGWNMNY